MNPNKTGYFSHPKILLGFILLIVAATAIFLTTRPGRDPLLLLLGQLWPGLAGAHGGPIRRRYLWRYGRRIPALCLFAPARRTGRFPLPGAMARWSPLPLPEDVAQALRQRVQAIGSLPGKELARDLFREDGNRQGFYCILSSWDRQFGAVLNHAHFDQDIPLFQNIVVGMLICRTMPSIIIPGISKNRPSPF